MKFLEDKDYRKITKDSLELQIANNYKRIAAKLECDMEDIEVISTTPEKTYFTHGNKMFEAVINKDEVEIEDSSIELITEENVRKKLRNILKSISSSCLMEDKKVDLSNRLQILTKFIDKVDFYENYIDGLNEILSENKWKDEYDKIDDFKKVLYGKITALKSSLPDKLKFNKKYKGQMEEKTLLTIDKLTEILQNTREGLKDVDVKEEAGSLIDFSGELLNNLTKLKSLISEDNLNEVVGTIDSVNETVEKILLFSEYLKEKHNERQSN